jgi:virulence-associated protein VagC
VPNQINCDLQERASSTSLLCPKCSQVSREKQYFCTGCGTSLTHQVDTNNMQNISPLPQPSVDSRKRSSAVLFPEEISLPAPSASLVGQEKQRIPLPHCLPLDSFESSAKPDGLTAEWAASVRMTACDLPPHLTVAESAETAAWKEELSNSEGVSPSRVKAFVQKWKLRRGECYLVTASVLVGTVLVWVVWWR